jgi:hypothetical protein
MLVAERRHDSANQRCDSGAHGRNSRVATEIGESITRHQDENACKQIIQHIELSERNIVRSRRKQLAQSDRSAMTQLPACIEQTVAQLNKRTCKQPMRHI